MPEFEIRESEDFKVLYATGVFGGLAPNDGRMILYLDLLKMKPVPGSPGKEEVDRIIRERLVEIHMSPATWKMVAKWMIKHVEIIEKKFGKIPEEPKKAIGEPGSSLGHIV